MTRLAINGGKPVRKKPFPKWPLYNDKFEEAILEVTRSRNWGRYDGEKVTEFETVFSNILGVERCVAVTTGSAALEIALKACGIGGGDEVIVPAYTFVATATAVLMNAAIPIFADIDPETFCIDPASIESKISERTKAIIPVHIGGNVCDMDALKKIAHDHDLIIIEDACQAHLAEWKKIKVGTIGDLGCFSFQSSKNISSGEGGAIVGQNEKIWDICYSIHNCGREKGKPWYFHPHLGSNYRLTELQAALLLVQLKDAKKLAEKRSFNAQKLDEFLDNIDGIEPQKKYDQTSNHAYHIYIMRFNKTKFQDLSRDRFIEALRAEGIPVQKGYVPVNKEGYIRKTFEMSTYRKLYDRNYLDNYFQSRECPVTENICRNVSVWLPQNVLVSEENDLMDVKQAIEKVIKFNSELL